MAPRIPEYLSLLITDPSAVVRPRDPNDDDDEEDEDEDEEEAEDEPPPVVRGPTKSRPFV